MKSHIKQSINTYLHVRESFPAFTKRNYTPIGRERNLLGQYDNILNDMLDYCARVYIGLCIIVYILRRFLAFSL